MEQYFYGGMPKSTNHGVFMLNGLRFQFLRLLYRHMPDGFHWRMARWIRSKVRVLGADGRHATIRCEDGFLMELELGEWIGAHIALAGEYEPAVAEVFRDLLRGGDTMIDVGANIGFFSLLAASIVGPDGAVHAIEASESTRHLLERNCCLNGWEDAIHIHPYAAWNKDAELSFYEAVSGKRGESSIRAQSEYRQKVTVPARRLDTLFSDLQTLKLLKIDVEGSEVEVLEGAHRLIRRCKPALIFELSPGYLRESGQSAEQLLALLEGYQFFILDHERRGPLERRALLHEVGERQVNVLALCGK